MSNLELFDDAGNSELPFRPMGKGWGEAEWDFEKMRTYLLPGEVVVALCWPYPWPEALGEDKGMQVSAIPDDDTLQELLSKLGQAILYQCFEVLPIEIAEKIGAL